MSGIEAIIEDYDELIRLPANPQLSGAERTVFVVYDPAIERRVRARIAEFEIRTKQAGKSWRLADLTDSFPRWLAADPDREAFFRAPDELGALLAEYAADVVAEVAEAASEQDDTDSVLAILGGGALFPMARLSQAISAVARTFRGQIVVFFPGRRDGANYRLLDARDDFSYLAIAITG